MSVEKKISIVKWLEFGITGIGILLKVVKEIVEAIPSKE